MKNILLLFCYIFFFVCPANAGELDSSNSDIELELSGEPLALAQCVSLILARSHELTAARENILEKEASLAGMKKDLYPSLSMWYRYMKELDSSFEFPGGSSLNEEDFYSYALILEQPIYKGKSLVTNVAVGQLDFQLSEYSLQKTRNDLSLLAHQSYYDLLKAQKLQEVAEQSVKLLASHQKDAAAFYDAGLIPKNDLLLAEVELAQGRQDLLKAKNRTSLASSVLNVLMKQPPTSSLIAIDDLTFDPIEIVWEEIIQQAMNFRSEIRQNEIAVQKAEKNMILTKAPYMPTVTLSATYKRQGNSWQGDENPLGSPEVRSAEALAQWKFWSWGQKKNKVAAAGKQIRKAEEALALVKDNITIEVRQAYLDFEESKQNISVTDKAVEQAEENFRINKARYQAQLSTSTDVLDAQTLLTEAKTNYYNALYDYGIALRKLDWAVGVLWESYNIND